jgi:hypothetical protein
VGKRFDMKEVVDLTVKAQDYIYILFQCFKLLKQKAVFKNDMKTKLFGIIMVALVKI